MAQGDHSSWTEDDAQAFVDLMLRRSRQHGVVFMDTEGRIRGWSHGAFFITGHSDDEALGQFGGILFTPEDRERRLPEHELNTARTVGVAEDERWHLRKDGSRFWSTGIMLPLTRRDGEVEGFVKVFRDATHLRTRMKYLENLIDECNGQRADRDAFLATISHELRSPLAPLKMAVELLRKQSDLPDRASNPLKVMDRQLGFLERLVEDLVDLTRVNAGKLSITRRTVVLQDLMNEALENCRSLAAERGLNLHAVLPQVGIVVEVNATRLHQVIVNLLTNAIKYTDRGGDVWATCSADQTHFLLYVKDNGKGIGRQLLPRIFEIFTQAEGSDSGRGAGLGIGLAVVKEIVALHKGTVEVRSEGEGRGSEFIVRIPLRAGDEAEPEMAPHALTME